MVCIVDVISYGNWKAEIDHFLRYLFSKENVNCSIPVQLP